MIVGIDDTDSTRGGCTTHVAAEIARTLKAKNLRLIRLNPNIPYKTRGNGAVSFEIKDTPKNRRNVIAAVKKHSRLKDGANPGVVFLETKSKKKCDELYRFYRKTVSTLVTKEEAVKVAESVGAETREMGNGRGIVGAIAAVGARLPDKTYELIAYRSMQNYGRKRKINERSVFAMNERLYPRAFDNVDLGKKIILITPRGLDPIFCGIRGETRKVVWRAWGMIKPLEDITDVMVFETNQATDAHLVRKRIKDTKPYDCVTVKGEVSSDPKTIPGGHVFLKLSDGSGVVDCGAYKPTGGFRDVIRKLREGDVVVACGGVGKYTGTLNLEKIYVKKISRVFESKPPACCGRRMTSAGKNKGFKCRTCGKRKPESAAEKKLVERGLPPGWYEVPPRARRHLSKPLMREKPTT